MRLVLAGTPRVAIPALDALLASDRHEVAAVVTRPDAPVGRRRTITASPVKERALSAGLEVLTPVRPSDPDFLERLRALDPDCCPVIAYGALLPARTLAIPTVGWINLHFSILPAWRGAAPVQRAIMAGDDVTGATTFLLDEGMDTGPVFGVVTTAIGARETAGDLLDRLAVDGAGLLVATLDAIEDGTCEAIPQSTDGVSLAPKLTPDDARIDWSAPAATIDRLVRACTPAPGAWTRFRGRRIGVRPVEPVGASGALAPGELRVDANDVLVGTGTSPVRLAGLRPEGKSAMAALDWVRGVRPATGDAFG